MGLTTFIFDLDGVLTDTAKYHFFAWKKIAENLDVDFNEEDNEFLKGVDRENSLQWILNKGKIKLDRNEFEALLNIKNQHYLSLVKDIGPSDLFDGVRGLFAQLRQQKKLIGLASASKNARQVVEQLGIAQEFDYIADSNFIVNNKPDPEIFLRVASALNQLPHQCVGIEDAVAGIQAINSAKMFSVGIGSQHELTEAEIVFPDLQRFELNKVFSVASRSISMPLEMCASPVSG